MQEWRPQLLLLGFFLILGFFLSRGQKHEIENTQRPVSTVSSKTLSKTSPRANKESRKPAALMASPARQTLEQKPKLPASLCGFLAESRYDNVEKLRRVILDELKTSLTADDFHSLEWLMDLPATEDRAPSKELVAMQSLSKAGLILGRQSQEPMSLMEAVKGLESLRAVDPDNSALELMLASIYSRQGKSIAADEALERGLSAKNFDIYIPKLMRRLLSAPSNSLDFMKALQLFMLMPIPDLDPLRDFLSAKTRDGRFEAGIFSFAESIVDQAIQSRTPYNHLDWWLSSYVMSSTILKQRGQETPRVHSLNAEFSRFPEVPNISMGETCDEAELDRRIQEFQNTIRR